MFFLHEELLLFPPKKKQMMMTCDRCSFSGCILGEDLGTNILHFLHRKTDGQKLNNGWLPQKRRFSSFQGVPAQPLVFLGGCNHIVDAKGAGSWNV